MSLPKRIHAWLHSSRPYAAGVLLAQEADLVDDSDLEFFRLGESSTTRQELHALLEEAHHRHVQRATVQAARNVSPEPVTKAVIEKERRHLTRTSDGYDGVQLPPELQELRNHQVKSWYKERSYLCGRLEVLPSDEDRLRDALRILELDSLISSAYGRLDAYMATGRDPGAPSEVTKSSVDLVKRLRTVESYLSRIRNGKRTVSPAKQKKWEEERQELQNMIDALPKH
jgi:hypothetical protein